MKAPINPLQIRTTDQAITLLRRFEPLRQREWPSLERYHLEPEEELAAAAVSFAIAVLQSAGPCGAAVLRTRNEDGIKAAVYAAAAALVDNCICG